MAKCDLSIELDDPQRTYLGGEIVTGVVRVRADASVKCDGLDVSSGWKTHGRGNVAVGTESTARVFTGEWAAGDENEYRFELPVANWPPSYHGHYLNIDHSIDVRAHVPWSFDPKASVLFQMMPSGGAESAVKHSGAKEIGGTIGCVIIGIVIAIFFGVGGMVAVATAPIGPIVLSVIVCIAVGLWMFKVFLPKYLLGDVAYQLTDETVSPGQSVTGELVIRPRKNVRINSITMLFQAREQCVSGSGSNRTTHKHVFFERLETLQDATTLEAGTEHRFPLSVELPGDAPYSVDLDDNDLIWSTTLRVDIPRWPDWKKELAMTVVPSAETVVVAEPGVQTDRGHASVVAAASAKESSGDGGITFGETVQHIWEMKDDREQVEMLVEAVFGLTFDIEAVVERRLLYSGDEDPHLYDDGYAVWAHAIDPALPMVLYVPHELADEFENIGRDRWSGRGTIVGWESRHRRLQVKIERPS